MYRLKTWLFALGARLYEKLMFPAPVWLTRKPWYDLFWLLQIPWLTQAVYVAAKLGIADLLKDGAKTAADLAELTQTHSPSLYRILRLLAGFGIFAEDKQGRFRLTPHARALLSDAPDSMRAWAVFSGERSLAAAGVMLASIRSGQNAYQVRFGESTWENLAKDPQAQACFNTAMNTFTEWQSGEILKAFPCGRFRRIVDVGGGLGRFLTKILLANAHARGVLVDQAPMIAEAKARMQAAGVADRCEFVAGSFFEDVPAGGDAYVVKDVLHDWDDAHVVEILRTCARAMDKAARLLVITGLIDPANGVDRIMKLLDSQQLVQVGGGERTQAEFEALFQQAGLRLAGRHPTTIVGSVVLEVTRC